MNASFSEKLRGTGKDPILSHHAYCITGERASVLGELLDFLNHELKFSTRGNPDFTLHTSDTLIIDESRRIKDIQEKRSFGARKVIVVGFNAATADAQNALLKALEEPSPNTFFFLIVPSASTLLPTLRSRVFLIESAVSGFAEALARAREFVEAPLPRRLDMAKSLADSIAEGESDRQAALELVGCLEAYFARHRTAPASEVFEDLTLGRKYLGDRAASVKMILEHLALVLPHA